MMSEINIADRIIESALSEKTNNHLTGGFSWKGMMTGEELLNMKADSIPFLMEGLLPQTGVVALAGSSDTGKSCFLRQLACSIVSNEESFLGFKINAKHKSVIYVSTEDDSYAMAYLLNKQKADSTNPADLKGLRFLFESDSIVSRLDHELQVESADCIIIDTFTDIYAGDLNASNKVRSFINDFSNLSKKHNCLFIFLHHTGKRTEMNPPSKDNLLGSQGFEAKMRLVLELRRDYKDATKRHLCIVKGNYVQDKDKQASYVLKFDEKMRYSRLDERVSFDLLAKPEIRKSSNADLKARAIQLKLDGLSVSKITETLVAEGYAVGRSTVGDWVRNCPASSSA